MSDPLATGPPSAPESTRLADASERLWQLWRGGQSPDLDAFLAAAGPLAPAELAAVLRGDQAERWRAGRRMPAEDYLHGYPHLRDDPDAILDLIHCEFLLRERLGEPPDADEFLRRFPEQADVLRLQIELPLAVAADSSGDPADPTPPGSSTGLGETLSAGNPDNSERSERHPELEIPAEFADHPRYRIVKRLGSGGMGTVYLAEHRVMDRSVA
jgi:hypothetical protein